MSNCAYAPHTGNTKTSKNPHNEEKVFIQPLGACNNSDPHGCIFT